MGDLLGTDSLQFGSQSGTSTTECSWMVREEASYFLRRGTPCIVTFLDCSKAFDMCQFSVLFQKLKKKKSRNRKVSTGKPLHTLLSIEPCNLKEPCENVGQLIGLFSRTIHLIYCNVPLVQFCFPNVVVFFYLNIRWRIICSQCARAQCRTQITTCN